MGERKTVGGRPVSANSGRMRKSRLYRLGEEERRASTRRMFDWRLPSWGENCRHAMRIFFAGKSERGGGLFVLRGLVVEVVWWRK